MSTAVPLAAATVKALEGDWQYVDKKVECGVDIRASSDGLVSRLSVALAFQFQVDLFLFRHSFSKVSYC